MIYCTQQNAAEFVERCSRIQTRYISVGSDSQQPGLPTSSVSIAGDKYTLRFTQSQGQYWAGKTPPRNNPSPNIAAANFVVINGKGCALNGTAVAAVLINQ